MKKQTQVLSQEVALPAERRNFYLSAFGRHLKRLFIALALAGVAGWTSGCLWVHDDEHHHHDEHWDHDHDHDHWDHDHD